MCDSFEQQVEAGKHFVVDYTEEHLAFRATELAVGLCSGGHVMRFLSNDAYCGDGHSLQILGLLQTAEKPQNMIVRHIWGIEKTLPTRCETTQYIIESRIGIFLYPINRSL